MADSEDCVSGLFKAESCKLSGAGENGFTVLPFSCCVSFLSDLGEKLKHRFHDWQAAPSDISVLKKQKLPPENSQLLMD